MVREVHLLDFADMDFLGVFLLQQFFGVYSFFRVSMRSCESAEKFYNDTLKGFESTIGAIISRKTPDDSTCDDVQVSVANNVIHAIVRRDKVRSDVWALLSTDMSSSSNVKSFTDGNKDKYFPLLIPSFASYYSPTLLCVGPERALLDHRTHTMNSMLTMQTMFDLLSSDTLSPRFKDISHVLSYRQLYTMSIILALKFHDKEVSNGDTDMQLTTEAVRFTRDLVLKDLKLECAQNTISKAVTSSVKYSVDHDLIEDILHRLSMFGICTMLSLARHQNHSCGFAGFSLESAYVQQERVRQVFTDFIERCEHSNETVIKEIQIILSMGPTCTDRIFKLEAQKLEECTCVKCNKKVHSLMMTVGLAFKYDTGIICRQCATGATRVPQDGDIATKLSDKTCQLDALRIEFENFKREASRERKKHIKNLKQEHAQEMSVLCTQHSAELAALSMTQNYTNETIQKLRDTLAECNKHTQTYKDRCSEQEAINEDLQSQLVCSSSSITQLRLQLQKYSTAEHDDKDKDAEITKLEHWAVRAKKEKQLQETINVQMNAQTHVHHSIMREEVKHLEKVFNQSELKSALHRADVWKERNAILTGESKAAWNAYNLLLTSIQNR